MAELIGARTPRVEDPRLVTGRGLYVDDIRIPGILHAAFVRSNIAHGRIRSVDVSAARGAPGVLMVASARELDGLVGMLQPLGPVEFLAPAHPVLADDKVRCTGEPLAIVVAESRALAEDACELVDVDIEPLPAVVSIDDALDPSSALLFEELGTNIVYQRSDTYGDVDAAFAEAHVVVSETFTQERMANVPMEGRAILFGRSELAEQYYDEILFHGASYADLTRRTPVVIVGATDVTTGNRIDFSQGQFDFICGDLTRFPLSRAAAASSAVPVVFSPVTLDNRGGWCGYRPTPWMTAALKAPGEPRTRQPRGHPPPKCAHAAGQPRASLHPSGRRRAGGQPSVAELRRGAAAGD